MRDESRERLEELASDTNTNVGSRAAARVELRRRDNEYAEEQEQSRRAFDTALTDRQLRAATDVARATKWAMVAAFAAAFGAIVQALMAIASYLK